MQYQGSVISSDPNNVEDSYTTSSVLAADKANKVETVNILDVEIDNLSKDELLAHLDAEGGVVVTPNVDHLMKLQHDQEFKEVYSAADFRVCDSKILMYAAKFLGTPIKDKISGSDLLPWFCEHNKNNPDVKIFMLGAAPGVAKLAQQRINASIGREIIVDAHSPSFGFEKSTEECDAIIKLISESEANVLVVGVGAPKQEKWIVKHRDQLPSIKTFLAVGAAIDFEAGHKPRSPQFVTDLGLEWLYRTMSEPKRLWRRYLIEDMPFFGLVFQQWLAARRQRKSA
ncbi:WecB/TagA/CpsF family glycosyltransferase [Leptothoe kymatousa]|uniref:WecB/TagA/CpsF family glycosyltransferase n=1 Tax=Leptothoe kymatousa TAU-MAC 1615 TaxID=2364775 RepID=A0ABS5Y0X2_9CYAN|nr:WecB/TagA/CpsF family glycosyltransferase [Leptothoe kymatousa]MBT9311479.1 WecB/TagA/CpsF family glycosyltransferase [Leptothoe kymatousa TAU-MAC 1615]